jgi:hypothetical protein
MVDLTDMTDEVYFSEMKMMFNTVGWSVLMQELMDQAELINDVQEITTADKLWFAKGQLNAIAKLLNFEEMLKRAEEEGDVPDEST